MEQYFTVAVTHFVNQGIEKQFEEALNLVIEEARLFNGCKGIQSVKLKDDLNNEYLLLVRFDTESNYMIWESSGIRKEWVERLELYVSKESKVRVQEGFEFWFAQQEKLAPTKWKMAIIVWLVIFPLILVLTTLAGKYLTSLHPYLRMLVVSIIMVSSMTYFIMPKITNVFSFWIFKKVNKK
jgi:antibiotic biosynthesis monooxygenase (ABM) superfamily enzyme